LFVENIIIYRLGSLGDTIVALPCFHKIAQSFPESTRILLTNVPVSTKAAPLEAILGGSGLVDRVIAYPVGTRSVLKVWRVSREIRAANATTLIYLMPARGRLAAIRDFIFFRLSGVRRIIGLPATADLQNNRVDSATGYLERECERLVRTMAALGPIDLAAPGAWDLVLTEQEKLAGRQCVDQFGGIPFLAINMGGKAAEKDWGAQRWTELLAALSKTHSGYGLLILGAAEDSARARAVSGNWPSRVVDACGRLAPRESAAALRFASIFIGHDSGPLHLAAVSDVPCVGLFGGFNRPKKWHPYAKAQRIIHRMEGMSAITVDEVAKAVSALVPPQG
jgi:ADP-heptose:LPS heptosyltransferase